MDFTFIITDIASILSFIGAAIIFYGGITALIKVVSKEVMRKAINYNVIRRDFTSKIIMGLEFFVANDLIKSVLTPSFNEVIILAIIVGIRTVVSYSLDKEIKELGSEGS